MTDKIYSLGLEDRDRLKEKIGGGIPKGSIMAIEAEYGGGKSVMSQRFAYGFCEEGYKVTYLSSELRATSFIDQMDSLNYNVEKHLLDENLLFLHAYMERDQEGEGKPLSKIMDAKVMWKADIIIVDTFDAILRNDKKFDHLVRDSEERQGALEIISFFRDLASAGKTIILTIDPTTLNEEVLSPFRAITDIHLKINMEEIGNDISRTIHVNRFSGMGQQVGDQIGFSVRPDIGVVVESRSVT